MIRILRRFYGAAAISSIIGVCLATAFSRSHLKPMPVRSLDAAASRQSSHQRLALWRQTSFVPAVLAALYLSLISGAELVTSCFHAQGGVLFHVALTSLLVGNASLSRSSTLSKWLLGLASVPMIRVVSLSMPLEEFPIAYWYLLTGLPLIVVAFVVLTLSEYPLRSVGLSVRYLPFQVVIAATGLGLGVVEYFILRPSPLVETSEWQGMIGPAFILLIGTGFAEEILFHGVLQRASLDALGAMGLVFVAAVFAVMHIGYNSMPDVAFVFGVGLFFGVIVMRTGSLLGATLSHGLTNIMLFLIAPFWLGS